MYMSSRPVTRTQTQPIISASMFMSVNLRGGGEGGVHLNPPPSTHPKSFLKQQTHKIHTQSPPHVAVVM